MEITKENQTIASKAWAVMSGFAEKVGDRVEGTVISVSSEEKSAALN